jgi:hypothetical protein
MNLIVIAGIGFGLIVVVLVGAFVVINMDLFSYTATGSEIANCADLVFAVLQ